MVFSFGDGIFLELRRTTPRSAFSHLMTEKLLFHCRVAHSVVKGKQKEACHSIEGVT